MLDHFDSNVNTLSKTDEETEEYDKNNGQNDCESHPSVSHSELTKALYSTENKEITKSVIEDFQMNYKLLLPLGLQLFL